MAICQYILFNNKTNGRGFSGILSLPSFYNLIFPFTYTGFELAASKATMEISNLEVDI